MQKFNETVEHKYLLFVLGRPKKLKLTSSYLSSLNLKIEYELDELKYSIHINVKF